MLITPRQRIALPTGLLADEITALGRTDKLLLADWHHENAGIDNGAPWLPAALRMLTPDQRLHLARNPDVMDLWVERERTRVIAAPRYFTAMYGHVRDDEEPGPAIPFDLWPAQASVIDVIETHRKVVILKARQLGLTWIALHLAVHLIALNPAGRTAQVLGLSQDGNYAKRLLERARGIHDRLPPWFRLEEARASRSSKSEFRLVDRGMMVSLPGTPSAPRSWQADLAICDEWAFVRNGQAADTMRALLPAARRIVVISSGDGGPDEEGNGQAFASMYVAAREQLSDWVAVFLPTSTHPRRTPEWRERERENYDTDEDFLAEHPETDDEALIGAGKDRFFTLSRISAAVALGAELDRLLGTDDMPPPVGDVVHLGIDYGEHSSALPIWELEAGGIYVPPREIVTKGVEPGEFTDKVHEMVKALDLQATAEDTPTLPIGEIRFDAAGRMSQLTFTRTAAASYYLMHAGGRPRPRKVPFSKNKKEAADYLRRLFKRVGEGKTTQVIAISPRNAELIRQLRGLESDGKGLWIKEDDHGPDSLIAGVHPVAKRHREAKKD